MKKILVIVLVVVLALSISLTSVTFGAAGKKEVTLAKEAGQAWLDRTVELTGEPPEWVGARLATPQVCYGLDGQPNAYMFTMENDGEVVGYIIVGSAAYGYPMFEAADCPPPSIPSDAEAKSVLQRDLGLKVEEIGKPTRLLYLGFDNLFAVYQAGGQEVAVNLLFDFAISATNLETVMPSPEDYKAKTEARGQSQPEPGESGSNIIYEMHYWDEHGYGDRTWCGPCSGVSIGWYYREACGYSMLPSLRELMYDFLVYCWGKSHPIWPYEYGVGFLTMTNFYAGYDFSQVTDWWVTGGDYWNRRNDIENGWPTAIYSNNFYYPSEPDPDKPHWVAMRGYAYWDWPNNRYINCTDSFRHTDYLWLDWDHLGFGIVTVTIRDG